VAGFRRILDCLAAGVLDGTSACDGAVTDAAPRKIAAELLLADCAMRLAAVAKEIATAEEDADDGRRKSIARISRMAAAIDSAVWLIEKNCSESAAIESFLLPQI
jgi:hypothetical protein